MDSKPGIINNVVNYIFGDKWTSEEPVKQESKIALSLTFKVPDAIPLPSDYIYLGSD